MITDSHLYTFVHIVGILIFLLIVYYHFVTANKEQQLEVLGSTDSKDKNKRLGGDLFLKKGQWKNYDSYSRTKMCDYVKSPDGQFDHFLKVFFPSFKEYLDKKKHYRLFLICGNADFATFGRRLKDHFSKDEKYSHKVVVILNEIVSFDDTWDILGLSMIPFKFGKLADWQRYDGFLDKELREKIEDYRGYHSLPIPELKSLGLKVHKKKKRKFTNPVISYPISTNHVPILRQNSIELCLSQILSTLPKKKKKKNLIVMSHCPPYHTRNSHTGKGKEYGSRTLRHFLDPPFRKTELFSSILSSPMPYTSFCSRYSPSFCLTGHAHLCIRGEKMKVSGIGTMLNLPRTPSNFSEKESWNDLWNEKFVKEVESECEKGETWYTWHNQQEQAVPVISTGNDPLKEVLCIVQLKVFENGKVWSRRDVVSTPFPIPKEKKKKKKKKEKKDKGKKTS